MGGESAALGRLRHYLWGTRAVSTYFDTRNGMLGADYSTKLSPWLALGCISPRTIHAEVAAPAALMCACMFAGPYDNLLLQRGARIVQS